MAELDDMTLLRDYDRLGSEAAFAEVVRRHINLVYSTAFRHTGVAAQAEEITQVVFVILARQAAGMRPDTILEGWLHETTRLTALRFLRGERRRQFREQESYMQSTLPESDDAAAWNQLAPLLDEALSGLGKKDRDAVMLRFFKDQSLREVAAALKVNEAAAQKRVRRAVEKLRLFFQRRGVAHPASVLTAAISAHSVQAAPAALAKTVTAVALAKGAAASGTTLTLITGALKIMAWNKAKTTVITAAVLLLGVGAGVETMHAVRAARAAAAPDIQGAWEGVNQLGGIPGVDKGQGAHTRLVFKIYKTNGVYGATADAIDLGIKDIQATRMVYEFPTLRFDLAPWTSFEATLNHDGTTMTFPGTPAVIFERTNAPDTVPERFTAEDYAPRAGSDLQGCWESDFPEAHVVYWKIAESPDGTFRGELDHPLVGENHKPFAVVYERPQVTLTVLYGTGIFQGKLNATRTEITGSWEQSGKFEPITLKRIDYQPAPAPAESAYAFRAKTELQGHWKTVLDQRTARQLMTLGQLKEFPVDLDIARGPDGTFSAALTLPPTEFMGLGDPMPASDFQQQFPNVRLEWKAFGVVFGGKLANGNLAGNLRLGNAAVPLTFER